MSARETASVAELPIKLTGHVQWQTRSRYPDFWRQGGVDGIYYEVAEALRGSRMAKTMPRWATRGERRSKQGRRGGTWRYVWNEGMTRCYVICRGPTRRGSGWVVITILSQVDPDHVPALAQA